MLCCHVMPHDRCRWRRATRWTCTRPRSTTSASSTTAWCAWLGTAPGLGAQCSSVEYCGILSHNACAAVWPAHMPTYERRARRMCSAHILLLLLAICDSISTKCKQSSKCIGSPAAGLLHNTLPFRCAPAAAPPAPHPQAPVGYPFADDLLGDYLRRLAAASKKVQGSGCQGVPFKHAATSPSGCKQEASHCQGNGTTCSSGQDVGCAPSSSHIKVEPGQEVNGACGTTCGTTCSMQGVVKQEAAAGGATGVAPPSCCGAGAAEGAGCGQNGCCQGAATANGCHSPTDGSTPQPAGGCTPQPTPAPGAKGAGKHTTANAEETGKLSIPLGVFLVGLICSGPFANTQVGACPLL